MYSNLIWIWPFFPPSNISCHASFPIFDVAAKIHLRVLLQLTGIMNFSCAPLWTCFTDSMLINNDAYKHYSSMVSVRLLRFNVVRPIEKGKYACIPFVWKKLELTSVCWNTYCIMLGNFLTKPKGTANGCHFIKQIWYIITCIIHVKIIVNLWLKDTLLY